MINIKEVKGMQGGMSMQEMMRVYDDFVHPPTTETKNPQTDKDHKKEGDKHCPEKGSSK